MAETLPRMKMTGYLVEVKEPKKITDQYVLRPFVINYKSFSKHDQYRLFMAVNKAGDVLNFLQPGDLLEISIELKGRYTVDKEKVMNCDEVFYIKKL